MVNWYGKTCDICKSKNYSYCYCDNTFSLETALVMLEVENTVVQDEGEKKC